MHRTRRLRNVVASFAAITLLATACGGDDEAVIDETDDVIDTETPPDVTTPTGAESPTETGDGAAAPPQLEGSVNDRGTATLEGDSISMEALDFAFDPTFVQYEDASTVTVNVENTGQVAHTFTIEEQNIDLVLQPGNSGSVEVQLPASGSTRFICTFHVGQGMQGAFFTG